MQNSEMPSRRSDPFKPKKIKLHMMKSFVRSKLRKYPVIETRALNYWRSAKFFFWKTKWRLNAWIGTWRGTHVSNINVDKIFWISPQKIVFCSTQEFNIHEFKGQILGGEWDLLEKKFESLDLYIAIKQVCIEGKKWVETVIYQRILDDLKKGKYLLSYQNERDLVKKYAQLESLFHNIQQNGYQSQRELFQAGKIQDPLVAGEEITVSIGRFGDFLFSDGAHRLSIAKLLKIPLIPVKVAVRHTNWIQFRNELLFYASDNHGTTEGKLYQPITHPDLTDLPASHECEDRYNLILSCISERQGHILDIGANLGYFCHRFEEIGFDCYAVENNPPTVSFLQRLARAENRKFAIITDSVLDSKKIRNTHFDIVLALNIFHHFLKTQMDYDKLVDLLKNIKMDELFFEPHLPEEYQMQSAYKNFSPTEFVEFIVDNSRLKNADLLGIMKDGRHLYRIY